jgi:hypothetical protein
MSKEIKIFFKSDKYLRSGDRSLGIVTGYGLGSQEIGVQFPAGVRDFSLLHSGQTSSGAQSASYTMDTGGSFPRGKAARA